MTNSDTDQVPPVVVGELVLVGAVWIHDEDFLVAVPVALEGDLGAVG